MLDAISVACPSAVVDHGNNYENGKFNPYVISAIYMSAGTIISDLGGYRFADAMSNIFDWKKFNRISAANGQFDNIHAAGLNTNNISATNGIFTNLSAASRLSASNLTSTYITTSNLTATNLTTKNANITNLSVGGQPY